MKSCSNELYQLPIGKTVVCVDEHYFRLTEVELLVGNAQKAMSKLGWAPKHDLAMLIKEMVEADVYLKRMQIMLGEHGYFKTIN